MIGLDTNILARYYIDGEDSEPKTLAQCLIAKNIIDTQQNLYVANTVMLEFEWVLRGIYKFSVDEALMVFNHLITLPNIAFENKNAIIQAIFWAENGLEFSDAFHLANYTHCEKMYSFDDKGFTRKVAKFGFSPPVVIPT